MECQSKILMEDNCSISGSHVTDLIKISIRTQRNIRKLPTGWGYLTQSSKGLTLQRVMGSWSPHLMFDHKSHRRCGNLKQNLNQTMSGDPERIHEKGTNGREHIGEASCVFPQYITRETRHEGLLS